MSARDDYPTLGVRLEWSAGPANPEQLRALDEIDYLRGLVWGQGAEIAKLRAELDELFRQRTALSEQVRRHIGLRVGQRCDYQHPDDTAAWALIGEAGDFYICDSCYHQRTEAGQRGWTRIQELRDEQLGGYRWYPDALREFLDEHCNDPRVEGEFAACLDAVAEYASLRPIVDRIHDACRMLEGGNGDEGAGDWLLWTLIDEFPDEFHATASTAGDDQ